VIRLSCEGCEINSGLDTKGIPTTRYQQRTIISIFVAPASFWTRSQVGYRQRPSRHSLNIEGLAYQVCILGTYAERIGRSENGAGACEVEERSPCSDARTGRSLIGWAQVCVGARACASAGFSFQGCEMITLTAHRRQGEPRHALTCGSCRCR
jgi:hypothetical protein